jgi:transcription elongation factor Elf1
MTEEIIDFQEHSFTCPYCGRETMVGLPLPMETILVSRALCDQCGREFLIENDVPRTLPR